MNISQTQTEAVAAHVNALLRVADIAQRDAALETGIPIATLSRRLTGKSAFKLDELEALAALLDLPFADLVKTDRAA